KGEVGEFVDGDDADLFVTLAFQLVVPLLINLDRDLRLVFDDVKISNQIAVLVDDEARTQSAGSAHLNHRGAELADQRALPPFRQRDAGGLEKPLRLRLGRGDGRGRSGCLFVRSLSALAFDDFFDLISRDDQYGVTEVHDDLIVFAG